MVAPARGRPQTAIPLRRRRKDPVPPAPHRGSGSALLQSLPASAQAAGGESPVRHPSCARGAPRRILGQRRCFGQPALRRSNNKLRFVWSRSRLAWFLPLLAGGLFATRDGWLPRPPLTLNCTDTKGMLEIRWNAAAARGLDHGLLLINDGGGGQLTPYRSIR